MKRRSHPTTTKKQSKNSTSAPSAKRSKNSSYEKKIREKTLTPTREMIVRTFYQWNVDEENDVLFQRGREEFERQLKTATSPHWINPFREELFQDEISLKSIMKIKNKHERRANVMYHLLKKTERSGSYGSGEVQFLIDHLCSGNRLLNNDKLVVHYGCLKMVEILENLYAKENEHIFSGVVNLWWKKPKNILRTDTKIYGKRLSFPEKIKWFGYYETQWKEWGSDSAWFSFLFAMAGGFFFHQRFITARGKPMYHRFNERL